MKKATLLIILAMLVEQASAVTIVGNQDCGSWRRNPDKGWLAGYISAMNAVLASDNGDALLTIKTSEQLVMWVDNYCRDNPLDSVQEGAHKLFSELTQRARAKK